MCFLDKVTRIIASILINIKYIISSTADSFFGQQAAQRPWNLDGQIKDAISHTVDLLSEGRKLIAELVQLRQQNPAPVMGASNIGSAPIFGGSAPPSAQIDIPVRATPDDLPSTLSIEDIPPVLSSADTKPEFIGSIKRKDAPGNKPQSF